MSVPPAEERIADAWSLFAEAEALGDGERRALLERLGRQRPQVAGELAAMLEASGDDAALAIESKLLGTASTADASGTLAGPYRLLRRIGSGGMGDVYLAERADETFEQRVAVKLMRPGIGSAEMVERFRLERDVLARLTHPAVVPLLDGGTTADGHPYLALQYVEGLPITDHCAQANLVRPERLRLFVALCRVVQYAHANLVVHRDLKPSNVLVTAEGEIRLLDFGVAKLLGGGSGREITRQIQAPMTPGRAAPEQLAGAAATTATDVWALGVLLHELLTGRIPEVGEGSVKRVDRDGVSPELPSDLTAIVGMALAREPASRYPSAGHLADDVERHLADLPVLARPDAWLYRTGRFVRRHRTATALAALTALFLVILTTVSSIQALRIAEQRNRAAAEERQANAVVDLLVELFGAADPLAGARMDTILVADLIDRGAAHADRMGDQPEVQARLRSVLGRVLVERGDRERGRRLLEAALARERALFGPDDPRTIHTTFDLARALHLAGELDAASDLVRRSVALLERQDDPDPELLALGLQTLGGLLTNEEGERLIERAISIRRGLPDADPYEQGVALNVLATHHQIRGERGRACALFQEAYELMRPVLDEDHPEILGTRNNAATCLPDPADRAREHREVLRLRRERLGPDHLLVANGWLRLAEALKAGGHVAAAEEGFREGWRIWHASAPTTSQTLHAGQGLVAVLEELGRPEEARQVLDATIEAYRAAGKEVPAAVSRASEENRRSLR